MKLKLFLSGLFLFCLSGPVFSGTEGKITADPSYDDGGNDWRPIGVKHSTTAPVIISTDAVGSFQINGYPQTLVWRTREIVNASTCAALTLYYDSGTYNTSSSSFSITLSSDPAGLGQGDSYQVPHQAPVWGLWSGGCGEGGWGASGAVTFWSDKKNRDRDSRTAK